MKDKVMFNKKTGHLGLKRCLGDAGFKDTNWGDGDKEWGSNYAIILLDPVMFTWDTRVRVQGNNGWRQLPDDDPRVQFLSLFDAIDSADWHYDVHGDENATVEYTEITNRHEVFEQVRKIFAA